MANLEKQVKILFTAQNETRDAFNQISSQLEKLQKQNQKTGSSFGDIFKGVTLSTIALQAMQKAGQLVQTGIREIGSAISEGANLEMMNTALATIGDNAGISTSEIKGFKAQLAEINTYGTSATEVLKQFIQTGMVDMVDEIQWASGKEGFEGYIETIKDFGATMGVSSKKAIDDFTTAIASLRPEMLEQYNITKNLPMVYAEYAREQGLVASELTETQKRMAVLNLVAKEGALVMGVYNETYQTTGKNLLSIKDALTSLKQEFGVTVQGVVQPLTKGFLDTLQTMIEVIRLNSEEITGFFNNMAGVFSFAYDGIKSVKEIYEEYAESVGMSMEEVNALSEEALTNFQKNAIDSAVSWQPIVIAIGEAIKGLAVTVTAVKYVGSVIEGLARVVSIPFNLIAEWIRVDIEAFNSLMTAGQQTAKAFQSFFAGDFAGAVANAEQALKTIGTGLKNYVADGFNSATVAMNKSFPQEYFDRLQNNVMDLAQAWDYDVQGAWNNAMSGFQKVKDKIGSGTRELAQSAKKMSEAVKDAMGDIQDKLSGYYDSLSNLIKKHNDAYESISKDLAKERAERDKNVSKIVSDTQKEIEALQAKSSKSIEVMKRAIETEKALNDQRSGANISALENAIANEIKAQESRESKLKAQMESEIAEEVEKHKEKIAELEKQLQEEYDLRKRYAEDFARFKAQLEKDDITQLKEKTLAELAQITAKTGVGLGALGLNTASAGLGMGASGSFGSASGGDTININITGNSIDSPERIDQLVTEIQRALARANSNAEVNIIT